MNSAFRIPHSALARAAAVALLVLSAPAAEAWACPVCFGSAEGPMARGVNLAIVALLGITAAVLGGFVAFFFHLMKRSRLAFGETIRLPGQAEERGAWGPRDAL